MSIKNFETISDKVFDVEVIIVRLYNTICRRSPTVEEIRLSTKLFYDSSENITTLIDYVDSSRRDQVDPVHVSLKENVPDYQTSPLRAVELARALIEGVLGRTAEEEAVNSYAGALHCGYITDENGSKPFTIANAIESLTKLPEFGLICLRHPTVAEVIARGAIIALMDRDPGPEVIAAYTRSLCDGYPIDTLFRELISYPEFQERVGKLNHGLPNNKDRNLEYFLEDVLVAKLLSCGCELSLPARASDISPWREGDLTKAISTLAFLGHADMERN